MPQEQTNLELHFSSRSNEWGTPPRLFNLLDQFFCFTLDPCCTVGMAKCRKFYTKEDDGLVKDWSKDIVFMNPPYGREIKAWMRKAYEESQKGAVVVCLVYSRTDTVWWHEYAAKGRVLFLRGRVKFISSDTKGVSAPFPSCLVLFAPEEKMESEYENLVAFGKEYNKRT
jgi:phage N-6-adenine-methyltransferase